MNQIDLSDRAGVVTGGARGIGLAIAERLLASGAKVSLWDVDADALRQAAEGLSGRGEVHTACVDVSSEDQVGRAAAEATQRFGAIDLLVNNAGITGGNKKAWEMDP